MFRIELQKIREANYYSNLGYNVVIDKSAIATIATAKAFERAKGFVGTFSSACSKYYNMLKILNEDQIVECDGFVLLTSDFEEIVKRNITRTHVLDGIWLEKDTINSQREVLTLFVENVIGKLDDNKIVTKIIDTTHITQSELLKEFLVFTNNIETEIIKGKVR